MKLGADFDAYIARFSPALHEPLALGVSGGSDSTALLFLVSEWAKNHRRKLIILTVDHRLRPESTSEAAYVAALAETLGHNHQTLIWDSPRKSQAAARSARHRMLATSAKRADASVLLLGHTLDDVTETILLRRRRGARGPYAAGPSMVSASPVWPEGRDLTLIRPLIRTNRQHLRDYLNLRQQNWCDDPSNENPNYERIAIRQHLRMHPAWREPLSNITATYMSKRAALEYEVGLHLIDKDLIHVEPNGLIHLKTSLPTTNLLNTLLRAAGGHDISPRFSNTQTMLTELEKPGDRATIAGAWLQKTKSGFLIGRDPGGAAKAPNQGLWDGRFERCPGRDMIPNEIPYLVRDTAPPDLAWREIISERLAHIAKCYQTPLLKPVQT